MRYIIETMDNVEQVANICQDRYRTVISIGRGIGICNRRLDCTSSRSFNQRMKELADSKNQIEVLYFKDDHAASEYCKETTKYLNA